MNNYSISTDGLATALQKSASALTTAGVDMDEALALITAGNSVTQDPDSVGAGMRTIALRLTGTEEASKQLEEDGEDASNILTHSKLRDTIKTATSVASNNFEGFDIFDDNGNYKNTYEILQGIADIYQEIIETDKKTGDNRVNLLLETLAGKNRANIAASILQNPEMLSSVYKSSQNSDGSADQENEKYLDSIEGRIAKAKTSLQELAYDFMSSDFLKSMLSIGTAVINVIDNIVSHLGSVMTTLVAIGSVKFVKDLFKGKPLVFLDQIVNAFKYFKDTNFETMGKDLFDKLRGREKQRDNDAVENQMRDLTSTASDIATESSETAVMEGQTTAIMENTAAREENNVVRAEGATASAVNTTANEIENASEVELATSEIIEGEAEEYQVSTNLAGADASLANAAASEVEEEQEIRTMMAEIEEANAQEMVNAANISGATSEVIEDVGTNTSDYTVRNGQRGGIGTLFSSIGTRAKNGLTSLGTAVQGGIPALSGISSLAVGATTAIVGLSAAVGAGVIAWKLYNNSTEQTSKRAKELMDAYKEEVDSAEKINTLNESVGKRYEELSKGVDKSGNNIGLTTDEYTEYKDIVSQIADLCPSLVSGFNSQGDAILSLKGNAEGLADAYQKAADAADNNLINNGIDGNSVNDIFKNAKNLENSTVWDKLKDVGSPDAGGDISYVDALKELKALNTMTYDDYKNVKNTMAYGTIEEQGKLSADDMTVASSQYLSKAVGLNKINYYEKEGTKEYDENLEAFNNVQDATRALINSYNTKLEGAATDIKQVGSAMLRQDPNYKNRIQDTNVKDMLSQSLSGMTFTELTDRGLDTKSGMDNYITANTNKIANNKQATSDLKKLSSTTIDDFNGSLIDYSKYVEEIQSKFTKNGEYGVDIPLNFVLEDQQDTLDTLENNLNSITSNYDNKTTQDKYKDKLRDYMSDNSIITEEDINRWNEYTAGATSAAEAIKMYEKALSESGEIANVTYDKYQRALDAIKTEGEQKPTSERYAGNVDLYDRPVMYWDKTNLDKYSKQLKSWGISKKEMEGEYSTLLGSQKPIENNADYKGTIEYTPIAKKSNGEGVLLSRKQAESYIDKISSGAKSEQDILKADKIGAYVDTYNEKGKKSGQMYVQGLVEGVAQASPKINKAVSDTLGKDTSINKSDFQDNLRKNISKAFGIGKLDISNDDKKDIRNEINDIIAGYGGDDSSFEEFSKNIHNNLEYILNDVQASVDSFTEHLDSDDIYKELYNLFPEMINNANMTTAEIQDMFDTKAAEELASSVDDIWNSTDFEDSKNSLTELANGAGIAASDIDTLAASNSALSSILDESGMSSSYLASCFNDMALNSTSASNTITADMYRISQAINQNQKYLRQANADYADYTAKTESGEDYNSSLANYESVYDTLGENFEKGEFGKQYQEAVQLLYGEGHGADSTADIKKLYKNTRFLYGNESSVQVNGSEETISGNGAGFITRLSQDQNKIKEKYGMSEKTYSKKKDDGSYDFSVDDDDYKSIAKYYGVTEEAIASATEAIKMYGGISSYSIDEVVDAFGKADVALGKFGDKTALTKDGVRDMLEQLGLAPYEIDQVVDSMKKSGDVKFFDFDTTEHVGDYTEKEIKSYQNQFSDLTKVTDDNGKKTIKKKKNGYDLESYLQTLKDLGMSWDEIESVAEKHFEGLSAEGKSFVDSTGTAYTSWTQLQDSITTSKTYDSVIALSSDLTKLKNSAKNANDALNQIDGIGNGKSYNFDITDKEQIEDAKNEIDTFKTDYEDFFNDDGTIRFEMEGAEQVASVLAGLLAQKMALEQPTIMDVNTNKITDDDTKDDTKEVQGIVSDEQTFKLREQTEKDYKGSDQWKKDRKELKQKIATASKDNSIIQESGFKVGEITDKNGNVKDNLKGFSLGDFMGKISGLDEQDLIELGIDDSAFISATQTFQGAAEGLESFFSGGLSFKLTKDDQGNYTMSANVDENGSVETEEKGGKTSGKKEEKIRNTIPDTPKVPSTVNELKDDFIKNSLLNKDNKNQKNTESNINMFPTTKKEETSSKPVETKKQEIDVEVKGQEKLDKVKKDTKEVTGEKKSNVEVKTKGVKPLENVVKKEKEASKNRTGTATVKTKGEQKVKKLADVAKEASQNKKGTVTITGKEKGLTVEEINQKFKKFKDNAEDGVVVESKVEGQKDVDKVNSSIKKIPKKTQSDVNVKAGSAISSLNSLLSKIRSFVGTHTSTLVTNKVTHYSTTGKKASGAANGTAHATGTAFAGGSNSVITDKIPNDAMTNTNYRTGNSQTALVGELGREMVVDPKSGTWHTVGDYGAEFTNIPRDSIIFNHKQTKELLSSGKITSGNKRGETTSALASGTALAHGTAFSTTAAGNFNPNNAPKKQTAAGNFNPNNAPKKQTATGNNKSSSSPSSSSKSSNKTSSLDKFKKWLENFFDWIEIKLDSLSKKTAKFFEKAELAASNGNSSIARSNYAKAIDSTQSEIEANVAGAKKYKSQANKVAKRAKKGTKKTKKILNAKQIKTFKNAKKKIDAGGAINISSYGEKLREVISAYQEWHDKAVECENAQISLASQIKDYSEAMANVPLDIYDTQKEKIDDVTSALQAQYEVIGENNKKTAVTNENGIDNITNANIKSDATAIANARNANLKQQNEQAKLDKEAANKALTDTTNNLKNANKSGVKIGSDGRAVIDESKVGTKAYKNAIAYNAALDAQAKAVNNAKVATATYTKTVQDNAKAMYDNMITAFEYINNLTDAKTSKEQSEIDLKKSNGKKVTIQDYDEKYVLAQEDINNAKEELEAARNAYATQSKDMSEADRQAALVQLQNLEQAWNEAQVAKNDVEQAQKDIIIQDLQNTIDDIKTDIDRLNQKTDLKTSQGIGFSANDYTDLINQSKAQVDAIKRQNEAYKDQQKGLDKDSDKYRDLQSKIDANNASINDAQKSQIEWNKAIDKMDITKFESLGEILAGLNTKLSNLVSLAESHGGKAEDWVIIDQINTAGEVIKNNNKLLEQYESNIRKYASAGGDWAEALGGGLNNNQLTELMGYIKNNDASGLELFLEGLGTSIDKMTELKDIVQNYSSISNDNYSQMIDQEKYYDDLLDKRTTLIDKMIEALNKVNDAEDRALALEKARYNLEKAKNNKTKKVWNGREWVYESDSTAIKDAQEAYDNANHTELINKLNDIKDAIEDLKDDNNLYDDYGNLTQEGMNKLYSLINNIDSNQIKPVFDMLKEQYPDIDWDKYLERIIGSTSNTTDSVDTSTNSEQDNTTKQTSDIIAKLSSNSEEQNATLEAKFTQLQENLISLTSKISTALEGTSINEINTIKEISETLSNEIKEHINDYTQKQLNAISASVQEIRNTILESKSTLSNVITVAASDICGKIGGISVNVSVSVPSASTSSKSSSLIKTSNVNHYATGGEINSLSNKDDVLIATSDKERVLTPLQNANFDTLTYDILPELIKSYKADIPDASKFATVNNKTITQEFNISMPNITDGSKANELWNEFQKLSTKRTQHYN